LQVSGILEETNDVYVSGKYAYVTSYIDDSLDIVDISNPTDPTLVGRLSDSSELNGAYSVYVSGKYAYVASNIDWSFRVIDISDPTDPVFAGELDETGRLNEVRSVYVSGKYAYVTSYNDDSLQIIDISDPDAPVFVGEMQGSGRLDGANDVYVSGKYAYVTSYLNDSLDIVDVSNPTAPTFAGQLVHSRLNGANGVYVSGKYAYVASEVDDSLQIINISNSSNPTFVGEMQGSGRLDGANSVYVSGKYAYVTSSIDDSLDIVDISDPSAPTFAGQLVDSRLDGASSVHVSGKYAYVTSEDDDSLQIIDIGGIDAPSAHIGDLAVGTMDVWENADVANDLSVGSGLTVGFGGIYSQGDVSVSGKLEVSGTSSSATDGILTVDSVSSWSVISLETQGATRTTIGAKSDGGLYINVGGGPYLTKSGASIAVGAGNSYLCYDTDSGRVTRSTGCGSSVLIKQNITDLEVDAIPLLNQLKPKKYKWKNNKEISAGFIAEEMAPIFPEAIIYDDDGNITGFNYDAVTALNTKVIQELVARIDALVGGNYSVGVEAVFDEDMVGTATVLVGETSVGVEFGEEYFGIPVVTLTPLEFVDRQYKVSDKSSEGFSIELQKVQEIDVGFDWHAFAVSPRDDPTGPDGGEVNETVNVSVNESVDEKKLKKNKSVDVNESVVDVNVTIPEEINETAEMNITIPEEVIEVIPEENVSIPENNNSVEIIVSPRDDSGEPNETEEIEEQVNETEKPKEKKKDSSNESAEEPMEEKIVEEEFINSPITGGVIGASGQSNIFTRAFDWIGGLFGGGNE
jgi:hypothetical protein